MTTIPFCIPLRRIAAGLALAAFGTLASAAPEPIRVALIEALSGPFANTGEAVARNLEWAIERVNQAGGVKLPGGSRPLQLVRYDSKGNTEDAIVQLRAALDQGAGVVTQGNSSAVAAGLIEALNKHNEREPGRRALLLNYAAVLPALTNEQCSFWHFRFDAHADMRLAALTDVMQADRDLKQLYLIGQDYSFGQYVLKKGREMLAAKRPDVQIVGDELHPIGRVKDFVPYVAKIKASGAQAVLTGNFGADLTLLMKAARDMGVPLKFYTFYGNALGAPTAIGEAGVGTMMAVAEWHPNAGGAASDAVVEAFHKRFPDPRDDYLHARMQAMIRMLADAIERARGTEAAAVARALEGARYDGAELGGFHTATMRADDHQLQQPLFVSVMDRVGTPGIRFDIEGSGFGFRTIRRFEAREVEQPHQCRMTRPAATP